LIRQAITCDVCASEKKQTNHWFVAFEQAGELRLGGWNSRNRLRPGMKHLCGQICLHKLVDEFMARTIDLRNQAGSAEDGLLPAQALAPRESAKPNASYQQVAATGTETAGRLLPHPEPYSPKRIPFKAPTELVAMPVRPATPAEVPAQTTQAWRAEAWDREREREMRAVGMRNDGSSRRRSGS